MEHNDGTQEMDLWQHGERRHGKKSPKMVVCPVCKGETFLRISPLEASSWSVRFIQVKEVMKFSLVRPCWACKAQGRIPVERRGGRPSHFER